MSKVIAVILAAGIGTRMKSKYHKVVHKICGKAMINWSIDSCFKSGIKNIAVVVGPEKEDVIKEIKKDVMFCYQEKQLGTGHAVMAATEFIKQTGGNVIILYGDVPLLLPETIRSLVKFHEQNVYDATVITVKSDLPNGYGRIIRNRDGDILKIVEQRDADEFEKEIKEINSGIMIYKSDVLLDALENIKNENEQEEYYLTDTIEEMNKKGQKVGAYMLEDQDEIRGINDRVQLSQVNQIAKKRILKRHMLNGVTIEDPDNTYIEEDVTIEPDVNILTGSRVEGKSSIGAGSEVGPDSRIIDSKIGENSNIVNSIILESKVGNDTKIGPFSYIRPGSDIGNNVKIGDFVEIKKSRIGDKTKISHLTYVGDAIVGENCNFGCGVVVVNYDGKKKSITVIKDNVFIGCNVNLIAPIELEKDSYIAAGSTITKNVTEKSLAIARSRQVSLENWVERKNMFRK